MKQILLLAIVIASVTASHAQQQEENNCNPDFTFELKLCDKNYAPPSSDLWFTPYGSTDSIVHYDAKTQRIIALYQFAYRGLSKDRFKFSENLNYIDYDFPFRYSLNLSAIDNQENYDSLVARLNKEFEFKTQKIALDTIVYTMTIKEGAGVTILKGKPEGLPDKKYTGAGWSRDSVFFKAKTVGKSIAYLIKAISGISVEISLDMENRYYDVFIEEKANRPDDIEEKFTVLQDVFKQYGIILEKETNKVEYVQITGLYSDFDATSDGFKYSPKQLRADADSFFHTVERKHINPYYHVGKEAFDQKKSQIYAQLNTPLTKKEFYKLISTINSSLDAHTQINNPALSAKNILQQLKDDSELVFPDIVLKNGKVFTRIKNKKVELKSINGMDVKNMTASIIESCPHLPEAWLDYYIDRFFPFWLPLYFDIHSPFSIEYKRGFRTKKEDIEGLRCEESDSYSYVDDLVSAQETPIDYEIYHESSTAILYINSFDSQNIADASNMKSFQNLSDLMGLRYLEDDFIAKLMDVKLKRLFDSLNQFQIKNLFIDVSKNTGGNFGPLYHVFNFLRHDTLFLDYDKTVKDTLPVEISTPNHRDTVGLPKFDENLFNGNIFVLQGTQTFSGGDLFCRIVRQNNLGVLIGRNASQYTKTYIPAHGFSLPYTRLVASIAFEYWDFSKTCNTETTVPDMQWETDNKFDFSENELNEILSAWEKKK
jgi:hypothetical protein